MRSVPVPNLHARLDAQVDSEHADAVAFLREMVRVPTDTPPGDNARHAEHTAALLEAMGYAHNGCLQLEVSVHGRAAHAAMPETGVDALAAATRILDALYAQRAMYATRRSRLEGIATPTLNVGRIDGGTNTNVVPAKVVLKLDRRMIPEKDPARVEAELRGVIERAAARSPGIRIEIRRLLLARALVPRPGHERLVSLLKAHAQRVIGEAIPATATPLYSDARLYGEGGVPIVLYGAGPRTILEANAKRADENLVLEDLRRATKVVAATLFDLLTPAGSSSR